MFLFRIKYDFLNLHLIISLVMLGCLRQRYYVLSQEFEFLLILPETLQCRGKYRGDRASANLQLNIFVVCCKALVSCHSRSLLDLPWAAVNGKLSLWTPTEVMTPPGRTISNASCRADEDPTASKTISTPRPSVRTLILSSISARSEEPDQASAPSVTEVSRRSWTWSTVRICFGL